MRRIWLLGILGFLGLLFWQIWERDPQFFTSAQDYYLQAQEALLGDQGRALALAEKAHGKNPENWDYTEFLAWRLLDNKRPAEALELFRQVREARPSVAAFKGQVLALEQLHRRPEALTLLDTHLSAQPQDAAMLEVAADLAAREKDGQNKALSYLQRLADLKPQDQKVRQRLITLLTDLGRFAQAIPLQEELVAADPENPQALHHLALLYAWQRDYQAAAGIYRRLLDLAADNQALRLEALKNAQAAQNPGEALAHALRLYALSGGQKDDALRLARLYSQKGEHAEAAAVLAPLMADQPSLEERRWYGLELLLAQEYGQSLKAYRQAWEAGDTHEDTIINLARLHAQKNQFQQAAGFWDEARRRQLLNPERRREAALTYSYAKRYQAALDVLPPASRQDAKLLLFKGQLHFYQKNWQEAARYYQEYLEINPRDVGVRQQLAQVLSFLPDRREEAAQQYEQSAKLTGDPRLELQRAAVLLQSAQDATDNPARRDEAPARWAAAAAALEQISLGAATPELLREQGRLLLWLGNLERALDRLEAYSTLVPQDRQAQLDKARVLIYLQRGDQAAQVLRRLPPGGEADGLEVSTLLLEAALAQGNRGEAQRLAWRLYLAQLPENTPAPPSWTAARRRLQENAGRRDLPPEARVAIARALCQSPGLEEDQGRVRAGVDLCLANLRPLRPVGPDQRRAYQASLLVLAYLLPRLSHYDDLQALVQRLPGIRPHSPEYLAALFHFTSNLGRQGGKTKFLLQTLKDRGELYPVRRPGDLIFLAALATELGDKRLAVRYLDQARRLRPEDPRLAALRLQAVSAANDPGRLLKALEDQPQTPETALEMARAYLERHQYEGAVAMVSGVPPGHPAWSQAQMLLIQAYRGQMDYPAAQRIIQDLEARGEVSPELLMAKGQVLEALADRAGAQSAYNAAIARAPNTAAARTAQARLARLRGDWAGAYRHFAAALQEQPQNIELLNELEQVREQLRPTLGARNLPGAWRGQRRPEEAWRPWQFGRYDREPLAPGGLPGQGKSLLPLELPLALIPETTILEDRNRIRALETRLAGGFWLGRTLPVHLALGYRIYQQHTTGPGPADLNLGLNPVFSQTSQVRTTWERAEATLTLGPLVLGDTVKVSGEISGRRYGRIQKQQVTQFGQVATPFPPGFLNIPGGADTVDRQSRNRLLGGLSVGWSPRAQTDLTLRYSRRDIFDQDPAIYPRLYQQLIRLDTLPLITLDQADLDVQHQFFPGLSYQGSIGQAFFSDVNRRFALYQALRWQVLNQDRIHLALTPSYYLAQYRQHHDSYFSPHAYHALGVTLDFDRQLFHLPLLSRFLFVLPTLVLQTTAQMVGNDGRWGPALSTLVGLEAEPVQNLYVGLHYFYFKEWATNYWFNSLIFGMKWRF